MAPPFISAIICTHNRANHLGIAIDSLLQQDYPCFEVLVVDNASTDGTRAVIAARQHHSHLRYIYEENLGLSMARNRGAAAAQGKILAYIDDDAEACPGWLAALASGLIDYPQAEIAGGPITLVWPEQLSPPPWLSAGLAASLGAYDLGPEVQRIQSSGQTPRGTNYAIRKNFLLARGGFATELGRQGTNLLSNEELHMTQKALESGAQVLYLPQAKVVHHVEASRISTGWFLRRSWWQGISEGQRERLTHPFRIKPFWSRAAGGARASAKALWHWRDPAQRFENLVYAYGQVGYLWSRVRHIIGKT